MTPSFQERSACPAKGFGELKDDGGFSDTQDLKSAGSGVSYQILIVELIPTPRKLIPKRDESGGKLEKGKGKRKKEKGKSKKEKGKGKREKGKGIRSF